MKDDKLQTLLGYLSSEEFRECVSETHLYNLVAAWANDGAVGLRSQRGKMIRVRIAVGQREGKWNAAGYGDESGKIDEAGILDCMWCGLDDAPAGPECVHWVEAYVPAPPEPKTVEGVVTP